MISLIHPSRGRVNKAFDTSRKWISRAGCDVEYILSIDSNDESVLEYRGRFGNGTKVLVNPNESVVEATNIAAKESTGDILLYLSDDFDCPENWGPLVLKEFEDRPMIIKVDDCLQPHGVAVLTIPIMNRKLYERLGYFWHPGYKSMFVDEDLYWTSKRIGALKNSEHLKFPHNHVSIGKAQDDETYRRSAKNWDSGKAFFAQRKSKGFPI